MSIESTLASWTGPSSTTEKDKQERTERMVTEAVTSHTGFDGSSLSIYAKGSYANDTNVKSDSDVDIVVQCHDVEYWEREPGGTYAGGTPYTGPWTPEHLREELVKALRAKFPAQVDASGKTAIVVRSSTARIDADVVPCFDYKYHFRSGGNRTGARVFRLDGSTLENYSRQQLDNGGTKNMRTNGNYKKAVRVLKRIENAMVSNDLHRKVPSFFVECLGYNVPDSVFNRSTWESRIKGAIIHIWESLEGTEPTTETERWLEVNEVKYLFHSSQKWTRVDAREFASAAWSYVESIQ